MKLLLDTHTLLWFLDDDPQLSKTAKQLIEDPSNSKHVSMVVCWEIAIKAGLKKLDLSEPASTLPAEAIGDQPLWAAWNRTRSCYAC